METNYIRKFYDTQLNQNKLINNNLIVNVVKTLMKWHENVRHEHKLLEQMIKDAENRNQVLNNLAERLNVFQYFINSLPLLVFQQEFKKCTFQKCEYFNLLESDKEFDITNKKDTKNLSFIDDSLPECKNNEQNGEKIFTQEENSLSKLILTEQTTTNLVLNNTSSNNLSTLSPFLTNALSEISSTSNNESLTSMNLTNNNLTNTSTNQQSTQSILSNNSSSIFSDDLNYNNHTTSKISSNINNSLSESSTNATSNE